MGLHFFLRDLGKNSLPSTLHMGLRSQLPCWPPAVHRKLLTGLCLVLPPDPISQNQQQSIRLFICLEFPQFFSLPHLLPDWFGFPLSVLLWFDYGHPDNPGYFVISNSLTRLTQAKSILFQGSGHGYLCELNSAYTSPGLNGLSFPLLLRQVLQCTLLTLSLLPQLGHHSLTQTSSGLAFPGLGNSEGVSNTNILFSFSFRCQFGIRR